MTEFEIRELPLGETGLAFQAMRALRTRLADAEEFVDRVDRVQRPEGYRLVAALPADGGQAAAVAGFRVMNTLVGGRQLYVDDLSTLPDARRRGLAGRLLADAAEHAREHRAGRLLLEVRTGNHGALALYEGLGFTAGRAPVPHPLGGHATQLLSLDLR